MPWLLDKAGLCVHKKNDDGSLGEVVKCHDTHEEAVSHMKALYANIDHASAARSFKELSGESLDQRLQQVRDAFYKTFQSEASKPMAEPEAYCYVKEIYDSYVIVEEGMKLYKVPYTLTDGKIVFDDRPKWTAVKISYTEMQSGFLFSEFAADTLPPKAIDGLAAGTFTAMSGDEVTFDPADLESYIQNTQAIIDSTTTESGEVVGLPIDKNSHDHAGGAGWIVGLELDKARNVIRLLVNWTQEGIDLIKGNLRRFFSPSTDPSTKTILGGSLTNWPATRNAKGQILLRPIELSQQLKEFDMPKTIEEIMADLEALRTSNTELAAKVAELSTRKPAPSPDDVTPEMLEFIANTDGAEELGKQAQEIARRQIDDARRKEHVKEFAARIVGGTPERPIGIPVRSSAIVAALLSMPDKQREFMEALLMKMWDQNVMNFTERGIGGFDIALGKPLPKEYREHVRMWVEAGKTPESWFDEVGADLGLGVAKDWNLKEFQKAQEE